MGVIIGFATQASLNGRCAANVNWGANPNTQRLYCLNGSFSPFMTIDRPTVNVNMTIYAPGDHMGVGPSNSCTSQDQVAEANVNIDPASCDVHMPRVNYKMVVNSYSYSKESAQTPGQESYSMVRWVTNPPTYVIRGIAEGSATLVGTSTNPNNNIAGITFQGTTTTASQGSVAAGAVGRADMVAMGAIASVGGGEGTGAHTGRGDATIPHTALWV